MRAVAIAADGSGSTGSWGDTALAKPRPTRSRLHATIHSQGATTRPPGCGRERGVLYSAGFVVGLA